MFFFAQCEEALLTWQHNTGNADIGPDLLNRERCIQVTRKNYIWNKLVKVYNASLIYHKHIFFYIHVWEPS